MTIAVGHIMIIYTFLFAILRRCAIMSRKKLLTDEIFPGLSARLRKIRISVLKLGVGAMGEKIGVSGATISRYESGEINIPEDRLRKYAEISGYDLDWFLRGDENNSGKKSNEKDSSQYQLDIDLLRQIIVGVETGLAKRGLILSPDKKAELIAILYEYAAKAQEAPTPQTVERYLRLVA